MDCQGQPRAAYELIARIEAKVSQLATPELTYMGWPGLIEGTRELLEWPYIIVYKVFDDLAEIVSFPSCTAHRTASRAVDPAFPFVFLLRLPVTT